MSPDTKQLILILAIAIPVGIIAGLAVRKLSPNSCNKYTKWSNNRQWKLFLFGFILFTFSAVFTFNNSKIALGNLFVFLAGFQAYCMLKYGFKHLTPEQEKQIDKSFPRTNPN